MADLFFRTAVPFAGKPVLTETGRPVTYVQCVCNRCGGAGGADAWKFTGWTCFECGGSGRGVLRQTKLYTSEELVKLDAILAKRHGKLKAKLDTKAAERRAEIAARRESFQAEHADILQWLGTLAIDEHDEVREGFFGSMWAAAQERALWSDNQVAALHSARAKMEERDRRTSASEWQGQEKARLTITAEIEHIHEYSRSKRVAYWETETVFIITFRDAANNCFVYKGTNFYGKVGTRLTMAATVKEHTLFHDRKQTVIQRLKVAAQSHPDDEEAPAEIEPCVAAA